MQLLFVLAEGKHPIFPCPLGNPLHNSLLASLPTALPRAADRTALQLLPASSTEPWLRMRSGQLREALPFPQRVPRLELKGNAAGLMCTTGSHVLRLTRLSPDLGHKEAGPATPRQLQPILAGSVQPFLHCYTWCLCQSQCRSQSSSREGMNCMRQEYNREEFLTAHSFSHSIFGEPLHSLCNIPSDIFCTVYYPCK